MWKHLLVPLDFSGCSTRALEVAVGLIAHHGAALTLVHVSPLPPNLPPDAVVTPPGTTDAVQIGEYATRGAREQLQAIAGPLRKRGIDVRTLARAATSGDIAGELLRAGHEVGADAIVIGTHGRTGLSHLLLGSVAEKVIRRATVPVITIRSTDAKTEPTTEERVAEDELAG